MILIINHPLGVRVNNFMLDLPRRLTENSGGDLSHVRLSVSRLFYR